MTKFNELNKTIVINDTDYLLLGTNLDSGFENKIASIETLKKALLGDTSNQYLNLLSSDGKKEFRLTLDGNGKIHIFPIEAYTSTPYTEGQNLESPLKIIPSNKIDSANNSGLVIQQIYGGGSLTTKETAVSHNFVELYNCNTVDINLNGLYLWYKPNGGSWSSLALRGIVPAGHSFLIRGNALYNINSDIVRCKITEYDQEWNISFSENGFTIYLCVGEKEPEATPVKYIKNELGAITSTDQRWVDMLGGGGTEDSHTIAVYEGGYYNMGMSRYCSLRRMNFNNGKNNRDDAKIIDYQTCEVEKFRPRSLADGYWNSSAETIQFNKYSPSMVNMCYGENGDTSRTFTFETPVTDYDGIIKYRKQGETKWIKKKTTKDIVNLYDQVVNIHRVIIHDLTYGTYEYQLGVEGMLTDIETFEVKQYNQSNNLKMLWTTDEQGFTEYEYNAVRTACDAIEHYEYSNGIPNFDCHLNTGDVSQNANRPQEWRYYYKYHEDNLKTMPHILNCGNNDLIDKKFGTAFEYYGTFENQPLLNTYEPHTEGERAVPMVSSYSFDVGFVHFVVINSNTEYMYPEVNTDEFLRKQIEFLDDDLTKVEARATKPRWVVVTCHLSPFTIVRTKRLQQWIPYIEKHKVDFVLCGHNHTYSRSIPLYTGYKGATYDSSTRKFTLAPYNNYVDVVSTGSTQLKIVDESITRTANKANGTYYIMCQATGYKQKGKEKAINLPSGQNLLKTENPSSIHDNGDGQPWWYAYTGTLPVQPTYIMVDFGYDKVTFNMYYIKDVLTKDLEEKITVNDFDSTKNERVLFDTLTVNYSDRNK